MRRMLGAMLSAGTALAGMPATAQTPATDANEIVVTGSRLRIAQEVDLKRAEDIVTDSISADDIAAVPDFNIPDALRRIAGVAAEFDEDEGRFVNVRGVDANLNVVTLDGIAIPSSGDFGGTGRAVNLEFLPSTSVKRLQIFKTFTPDIDGGSVGGQVNLITRSAFDRSARSIVARATVSQYEQSDIPPGNRLPLRFEVTGATRFGSDRQFGLVLTGLYSVRSRDQVKFFSVNGFPGAFPNIVPADRFNVSLFDNDQTRYGANGKFEFKQGDTYAFLSGYYYKQKETESRYVNNLQLRAADIVETSPTTGRASQSVSNIANDYFPIETAGKGAQFLFDQRFGKLRLVSTIGYGEQRFDHETPALNFQSARRTELGFTIDTSNLVQMRSGVNTPAFFATPANYTATLARFRDLSTVEGLLNAKTSLAWNAEPGAHGLGFKLGAEYRRLRRARDNEQFDLSVANRAALRLTDLLDPASYQSSYQPEPFIFLSTDRMRAFFATAPLVRDATASTSADFVYVEKITSGFAMGSLTGDNYKIIAGARYEATRFTADAAGQVGAVRSSFQNFLPSINARVDLAPGLVARAAYSRTLGRPNPGDLAATTTVTPAATDAPTALIVTRGNPDLRARQSDNFDVSLEYYFDGSNGLLSAALFSKNIKGDIFTLRTRGDFQGQTAEFRQNINAEGSRIKGIELSASLGRMPFLPGALSGLGISANVTFIEGRMTIPSQVPGNTIAITTTELPQRIRQPEFIANAALFYNWKGFEARVAYNRTSSFLTSLNQSENAYSQVDASMRYNFGRLTVSLEGRNLTSADRIQRAGLNDFNFLFGKIEIDRSFHLGVTLSY
jgi:iron complex outermembrane recepter protein